MQKFINHVDHVAWLSRPENLGANVARLEELTGERLSGFDHLGDIDYADGVIPFGDAGREA